MAGATLTIKILADATQAAKTMDDSAESANRFASGMRSAAIPAAAAAAALGVMAKAAADDAQGQAVLAQQLRNTTGATQGQVDAVEAWISKTTLATGVADDQLRPAMASLARATGDVSTAQAAMGLAMDIAAATGKPLESVADGLAKAYAGNTGALSKLVPGLDKAVLATGDMAAITQELSGLVGGTAAAAADTAAGKYQRMQVALSETKESIGAALLPALTSASGALASMGTWAAENTGTLQTLVVVLASVAAIILVVNAGMAAYNAIMTVVRVATAAWTAVQWLLNAALTANPIGIIILLIVALVAAIVLAYRNSETFRNIVASAWEGIQAAVSFAWNAVIKPALTFLVAYWQLVWEGAQLMWSAVVTAWNAIVDGVRTAVNWVKNLVSIAVNAFLDLLAKAESVRDRMVVAIQALADRITAPFRAIGDAIEDVIGIVQRFIDKILNFKLPDWLTSGLSSIAGAVGLSVTVPPTGGVVLAPTVPRARGLAGTAAPGMPAVRGTASGDIYIDVYLDGQKIRGVVQKVVDRSLRADGARYLAGAWAP